MSEYTMKKLIEHAVSWELKVRDIYKTLAGMFKQHTVIRLFWQEMSDDEAHHADILQNIKHTMPDEELHKIIGVKEREAAIRVESLLEKDLLAHIANLNDAYELAHDIEDSEVNAIFRLVAVESVTDDQMHELISAQIDEHVEKLMQFAHKFKPAYRRTIGINSVDSQQN